MLPHGEVRWVVDICFPPRNFLIHVNELIFVTAAYPARAAQRESARKQERALVCVSERVCERESERARARVRERERARVRERE